MIYPTIVMKKIKENESEIYYSVEEMFDGISCYIGIDLKGDKILFFGDLEFKEPIGIIDFKLPNNLITIPGVKRWLSTRVAYRIYKTIQNKESFPENFFISS